MYLLNLFFHIAHSAYKKTIGNPRKWGFREIGKKAGIGKPYLSVGLRHVKIGDYAYLTRDYRIVCSTTYFGDPHRPHLSIGNHTFINHHFTCLVSNCCVIGDNVLIASNVFISTENHGVTPTGLPYVQQPLTTAPVKIGNNVWIGEKACILAGVALGDWCVVGAGSVVTHSFPAYSMIGGSPARLIKIYNPDTKQWIRVKNG